jgi:hypothetical protein
MEVFMNDWVFSHIEIIKSSGKGRPEDRKTAAYDRSLKCLASPLQK